jgi:SAM-dependent methyltransferase
MTTSHSGSDTAPGDKIPESLPTSSQLATERRNCRFCGAVLQQLVVDLGMQPLCQSRVLPEQLNGPETFYPLRAYVCNECWLVQVHEHVGGEDIFGHGDYAYFSSYSETLLAHSAEYVDQMTERLGLDQHGFVVELASNDGYLLQYFLKKKIPCLGIEPAENVAAAARLRGVPSLVRFFGSSLAQELVAQGKQPDLLLANNVYAHVPDVNDFTQGMKHLLKPRGVITIEVSHLMRIFENNLFDTIYQEHYCYYSLLTLNRIFAAHGLTLFDVEELPTQGGSIRVYGRHVEDDSKPVTGEVQRILAEEHSKGYNGPEVYREFATKVAFTKRRLLSFLIEAKDAGKRICAYGAPGKGNTLLNYCGIREDFIDFTVDRNPMKQNTCLVGSRIPVFDPAAIAQAKPDYVLILPWNLEAEIVRQLDYIRQWGGRFVVPLPQLHVVE